MCGTRTHVRCLLLCLYEFIQGDGVRAHSQLHIHMQVDEYMCVSVFVWLYLQSIRQIVRLEIGNIYLAITATVN